MVQAKFTESDFKVKFNCRSGKAQACSYHINLYFYRVILW